MAPRPKKTGQTSTNSSSSRTNSGVKGSGATRRNIGGVNSELIQEVDEGSDY